MSTETEGFPPDPGAEPDLGLRQEQDWTVDPESGRSNSSPQFRHLVDEIARLIRDDKHLLVELHAERTAGLIMAQLAHKQGLVPRGEPAAGDLVTVSREDLRAVLRNGSFGPDLIAAADRLAFAARYTAEESAERDEPWDGVFR